MDLVAFLRARLDDDERYLRELTAIGERKRDSMTDADFAAAVPGFMELMTDPDLMAVQQWWVALGVPPPNDMGRLLGEIAAKREIVELHDGSHECSSYDEVTRDFENCTWVSDGQVCSTVRYLAAVYSGHPDYQRKWAIRQTRPA